MTTTHEEIASQIASFLREEELNWRTIGLYSTPSTTNDRIFVPIITKLSKRGLNPIWQHQWGTSQIWVTDSHPMIRRIAARNRVIIERLKELGLFYRQDM